MIDNACAHEGICCTIKEKLSVCAQEAIQAAEKAATELFEAKLNISRVFYMVEKSGFQPPALTPIWEQVVIERKGGKCDKR